MSRNALWEQRYRQHSAAEMAKEFETPSRPLFRYRAAIAGMLPSNPGMSVAEIGAGSGFIARVICERVGPEGRVFANELEPSMVAYMASRARAEGLANFTAVQGTLTSAGLSPSALDAIVIADAFSCFERPDEMVRSIAEALKPAGMLVIVDLPQEGQGPTATGVDADDVVTAARRAGSSASTKYR